jgi:Spondin_N
MKRLLLALALLALAGALSAGALADDGDDGDDDGPRTKQWQVTVENLTPPGAGPPGSQPLSPPLFVVHSGKADVWSVGAIASHPVAAIAEDANNGPAESALADVRGVRSVFTGTGGPIPSGESRTYVVATRGSADRLSVVTMLVNTNDAFTGLDSLRLRGRSLSRHTGAYDAGSEANNEQTEFIPGPCCGNAFVRDPEGRLIRMHPGILGIGDLDPAVYGWDDPVAKITIERQP